MSNFGFRHLRVVNPYEAAFREARSAVGASALLKSASEYASLAEAVADCTLVVGTTAARHRELQHPLRNLQEGTRLMRKRLASGHVALLFGSEKRGLSNHDFSYCHWLMRIPTHDEHSSMNLGQAVAVCLYELVRGSRSRGKLKISPVQLRAARQLQKNDLAAAGQLERITVTLLDALAASGYLKPQPAASTEEKVRRLVRRLNLPASDAELWLGMLRQMVWKMRSEKEL